MSSGQGGSSVAGNGTGGSSKPWRSERLGWNHSEVWRRERSGYRGTTVAGASGTNRTTGGAPAAGGSSNRGGTGGVSTAALESAETPPEGLEQQAARAARRRDSSTTMTAHERVPQALNLGWKFHLGDVSNAQTTTFDDSSWTSLDVPHDWSISLAFNQNSTATYEGGYSMEASAGTERRSLCPPRVRRKKSSFSSMASTWTAPYTSTARRCMPVLTVIPPSNRRDGERQVRRVECARRQGQQPKRRAAAGTLEAVSIVTHG